MFTRDKLGYVRKMFSDNCKKIIGVFFVSIFIVAGVSLRENKTERINIDGAINRGLDFLHQKQNSNGEFSELACENKDMLQCSSVKSLFSTTAILYSILDIDNEKVDSIKDSVVKLLKKEKYATGMWSYYNKDSGVFLFPDLDDSSVASFVLRESGENLDNLKIFENNRNKNGLFLTWVNPFEADSNDVDCGVNANVLMYLQKNDKEVCKYINDAIKKGENCTIYYPDKLAMYYIFSRAAKEGADCLEENKNIIIKDVIEMQKTDGSFGGDIENAFALNVLFNFKYSNDKIIKKTLREILKNQQADGSWKEGVYWATKASQPIYYGSKELTTALSLEALKR